MWCSNAMWLTNDMCDWRMTWLNRSIKIIGVLHITDSFRQQVVFRHPWQDVKLFRKMRSAYFQASNITNRSLEQTQDPCIRWSMIPILFHVWCSLCRIIDNSYIHNRLHSAYRGQQSGVYWTSKTFPGQIFLFFLGYIMHVYVNLRSWN